MPIRASAASQIEPLIAALSSSSALAREAAVARLTVIGVRAVDRLVALASRESSTENERIAALHALEGIGDARAFEPARAAALGRSSTLAVAGVAALRRLLRGPKETQAIEALTSVALDTAHPALRRLAAADALSDLGDTVIAPLAARLAADPDPAVATWVGATPRARKRSDTPRPPESLDGLLERLPDDPEVARRAGAHVVLAERGSRIALYDVRETLAAADGPLPVEFLQAITTIGDASCLEPLAAAYAKSTRSGESWWREHLRRAFHAIVQRDRITTRHAAMKRVIARYPAIVR